MTFLFLGFYKRRSPAHQSRFRSLAGLLKESERGPKKETYPNENEMGEKMGLY
jgi:hypothetical protein